MQGEDESLTLSFEPGTLGKGWRARMIDGLCDAPKTSPVPMPAAKSMASQEGVENSGRSLELPIRSRPQGRRRGPAPGRP